MQRSTEPALPAAVADKNKTSFTPLHA